MSRAISRRDLFERFIGRLRISTQSEAKLSKTNESVSAAKPHRFVGGVLEGESRVAVIQGRFCIALTSFCTVCVERCPVPGAMVKRQGLPQVVADCCTGCGICQEVCPAPRNAVLMIPSKKRLRLVEQEVRHEL